MRKAWDALEAASATAMTAQHMSDSAATVAKAFPTAAVEKAKEDGPASIIKLLLQGSATRAMERVLELKSAYAVLPSAAQAKAGVLHGLVQSTDDFKTLLCQHMAEICNHIQMNLAMKVLLGKESPTIAIDLSEFVPTFLTMCNKLEASTVECVVFVILSFNISNIIQDNLLGSNFFWT